MQGAPRSKQFDDVYFSTQNGLEETRHVFLKGNNLPERWHNCPIFTIAETGFGTGLNFLATAQLFIKTAKPMQQLHFISWEKFPLQRADIEAALQGWKNEFENIWKDFLKLYPDNPEAGIYEISLFPHIKLTLIFDDINHSLPNYIGKIDCWFLDGFKPSANPDMWSELLFSHMARLSLSKTTFATFTAAGFVKRGLQKVGFEVSKVRGYGTKRDMLTGRWP